MQPYCFAHLEFFMPSPTSKPNVNIEPAFQETPAGIEPMNVECRSLTLKILPLLLPLSIFNIFLFDIRYTFPRPTSRSPFALLAQIV